MVTTLMIHKLPSDTGSFLLYSSIHSLACLLLTSQVINKMYCTMSALPYMVFILLETVIVGNNGLCEKM